MLFKADIRRSPPVQQNIQLCSGHIAQSMRLVLFRKNLVAAAHQLEPFSDTQAFFCRISSASESKDWWRAATDGSFDCVVIEAEALASKEAVLAACQSGDKSAWLTDDRRSHIGCQRQKLVDAFFVRFAPSKTQRFSSLSNAGFAASVEHGLRAIWNTAANTNERDQCFSGRLKGSNIFGRGSSSALNIVDIHVAQHCLIAGFEARRPSFVLLRQPGI